MAFLRDSALSYFGTVPACDRQTGEQTDGHTTTAYTTQAQRRAVKNGARWGHNYYETLIGSRMHFIE